MGTQRKPPPASGQVDAADDTRRILDSVRRIVRVLRIGSRAAEKKVGVSGAQLFVLQKLTGQEPMSLNELAERTHTHQSSVSVVVQRLVERGLTSRVRSRQDARRIELTLTPAARALLRKAPHAAQDRLMDAIDAMPTTPRRQLADLLGQLIEATGIEQERAELFFEEEAAQRRVEQPQKTPRVSRHG